MAGRMRWVLATVLAVAILAVPAVWYRAVYSTEKRFREVTPGKFYRCGQMSAGAFRKELDLHRPIYQATAAYGHFGRERDEFTWERRNRADALREAAGLAAAAVA